MKCEVVGILNAGIYNFTEEKENDGFRWVKLDKYWCACTDMSRILEIEDRPVEDGSDHSRVDGNNLTIEALNKTIQQVKDKISLYEKQEQEYNYFVAPKEDIYYIRLKKNETLKYLRRD